LRIYVIILITGIVVFWRVKMKDIVTQTPMKEILEFTAKISEWIVEPLIEVWAYLNPGFIFLILASCVFGWFLLNVLTVLVKEKSRMYRLVKNLNNQAELQLMQPKDINAFTKEFHASLKNKGGRIGLLYKHFMKNPEIATISGIFTNPMLTNGLSRAKNFMPLVGGMLCIAMFVLGGSLLAGWNAINVVYMLMLLVIALLHGFVINLIRGVTDRKLPVKLEELANNLETIYKNSPDAFERCIREEALSKPLLAGGVRAEPKKDESQITMEEVIVREDQKETLINSDNRVYEEKGKLYIDLTEDAVKDYQIDKTHIKVEERTVFVPDEPAIKKSNVDEVLNELKKAQEMAQEVLEKEAKQKEPVAPVVQPKKVVTPTPAPVAKPVVKKSAVQQPVRQEYPKKKPINTEEKRRDITEALSGLLDAMDKYHNG